MSDETTPSPLSDKQYQELVARRVIDALKAERQQADAAKRDSWRWMTGTVLLGLLSIAIGGVSVVVSMTSALGDLQRVQRDVEPVAYLVDRVNRMSGLTKGEYQEASESSALNPQLDLQGPPAQHTVELQAGFLSDPFELPLFGGGDVDAFNVAAQDDCVGHVNQTPDVQLTWSGRTEELRIFFTADNEIDDPTLIVWRESGDRWFCGDDSSSLNPLVVLKDPTEGQYRIWIGSFDDGSSIPGRLSITELALEPTSWIEALSERR